MEPRFQTERGVRKPDFMAVTSKQLIALDFQIRSDYVVCKLDAYNREKIAKYSSTFWTKFWTKLAISTAPLLPSG